MISKLFSRERKYPRDPKSPLKDCLFSKIYTCRKNDGTVIIEKRVLKSHVKYAESEAQTFKKICNNSFHHPNVVLYLDAIEDEDAISLYMEKCDGDLEEWTKNGKLNACNLTALEICEDIIEGISYLHGQNIIHRDVKPSNFLIRSSGENATIKVTDFGLSKILATDVSSAPTTSTSTEAFMAPEYHLRKDGSREKSWKKSADIFSLGITLYYVLTNGRHPFGDKNPYEAPHNIQQKASPDLDLLDSVDDLSQEQKELAKDLIKMMFGFDQEKKEVDFDPEKRPAIQLVKFHPLFWMSKKKIDFYKEANRWFYSQSRKNVEKYQQALKYFENECNISINNVPSSLRNERKFPIKECGNVHQLLQKVIRNMDEHGDEKSDESMKLLGFLYNGKRDYDKFLLTLTGPYPGLLAYLWWYLSDEEIEGPYYPMKDSPHTGSTKQGSLVGNTQQSRPQQYPQQPSRFIPPLHNYRMNYNNNHGLRARHPLTNNAPSCFQQATGFAPPICNQVQPALPQQPHRNRGYDIMSNPPLAHPGGASQHSNPSQHSQIAVVPIQDMHAETSGTMVQVGDYIPTMSRKPDEAALQIPNQNSQLLSTSQTGGVGQPLTNQNNEFDSQQPTHEECRQNMMDTSFINSGGYAQHSTTLEDLVEAIVPSQAMPFIGNLGTIDSIGNNISSLNQNFHEVEQPASNQYTELQSTSKSQQQQQTDEENRVDVEETASIQRSDLSEVEDSESDKLSSDSSDGEADDDMSEDSLYGSVENSQHRKIICKLTKYEDECGSDDVYHLQRLYKRIHEINDEQLTSKALELFPQKLSFRYATFTELDSFLFVLTKVEKCIEMLDLSHRFSKPEDVGRIFSAIQQMPGKIRELRISGNIIPKIPSSSFFNKVSEELWMRRCFHDEGTRNGKRDANQSEKDKIQKNLDQLDNLELEVYVGVDEDGCLVSLSSQKQFAVTTTKNAERRKITHKIEKFQRGCNVYGGKEYEATELLRVYEQILQINDEQLTTYAAELFPEELSLYPIKLTESQIDSFLFILTKVEKRIEGLLLDECFSKPEDVGRLFEAIQAMPGKIGELDISGNIIPKIPSKSFFNKIEDELNMFNCFPVDDAINGQRNANQSEIAEIQRVLDQLDDSKLKVNLGLRDGEPVELRSRK
ncbi:uncharacterized protein LOC143471281 isoform X3 [Clavelina lepadiformis]|uniref:uncharacterized protein LOC143471281 isoform X3 n=1 Tax=Clavelina lepadiformis TaxID=159417 RepID=UPI004042BC16